MKTLLLIIWNIALAVGLWEGTALFFSVNQREKISPSTFYSLPPNAINLITLGHKPLFDHIAVIHALQYLGDPKIKSVTPPDELFNNLIAKVLLLGPTNEYFYMLSCFVFAFDYKRADLCEKISQAGIQAMPDGWKIPITQGYIENFELKNPGKAGVYYQLAASRPKAPAYLAGVAQKLTSKDPKVLEDPQVIESFRELPGGDAVLERFKKIDLTPPTQEPAP